MNHFKIDRTKAKEKINDICSKCLKEDGFVAIHMPERGAKVLGVDLESVDTAVAFVLEKSGDEFFSIGHIYNSPIAFKNGEVVENPPKAYIGIDFRSSDNIKVFYMDSDRTAALNMETNLDWNDVYMVYWESEDYAQLLIGSYDFARKDVVRRILTSKRKENKEFLRHLAYELLFSHIPQLKKVLIKDEDDTGDEIF